MALFSTTLVGLDDGDEEGLEAARLDDDAPTGEVGGGVVDAFPSTMILSLSS